MGFDGKGRFGNLATRGTVTTNDDFVYGLAEFGAGSATVQGAHAVFAICSPFVSPRPRRMFHTTSRHSLGRVAEVEIGQHNSWRSSGAEHCRYPAWTCANLETAHYNPLGLTPTWPLQLDAVNDDGRPRHPCQSQ